MTVTIAHDPVPLQKDADGVIRVAGTRIPLDTVVQTFNSGASPEEIVYQYPSLDLANVYNAIGYYLRNQADIDEYVRRRRAAGREIRRQNISLSNLHDVRQRLLARRSTSASHPL